MSSRRVGSLRSLLRCTDDMRPIIRVCRHCLQLVKDKVLIHQKTIVMETHITITQDRTQCSVCRGTDIVRYPFIVWRGPGDVEVPFK